MTVADTDNDTDVDGATSQTGTASSKSPGCISRRGFMGAAVATAAFTIVPRQVLGGAEHTPPSEMLNVAVIGTGGQGLSNLRFLLHQSDVRIMAIADPNWESDYSAFYYRGTAGRGPALGLVKEAYEPQAKGSFKGCADYADFREMLEREKDIDAVLIATPDHVHYAAAMAAIQHGKHVYCEKPMCHSLYEVRKLAETAREAKVATQLGNQGHSGDGIRAACEWIWDGAIGPVREVHAWSTTGPEWTTMKERPQDTPPVPEGLDWDLWLGPAACRPYHPAYAPYNWRGWWDFGTGGIGDMACHNLDPAFWALSLDCPVSVEASSCDCTDEVTPHASIVHYEFPVRGDMPPVKVHWYDGGILPERPDELGPDKKLRDNGILFVGDKGKLMLDGWSRNPRLIPESAMEAYTRPPETLPRSEGHHRDWIKACKGDGRASSNFDVAGPLNEAIMMGIIAIRTGEKLYWDGPAMRCTNVPAANDLIWPVYREGWSL
ncbi:MAG: Gfo/Idh/MocA family oxidoreductase [Candidatus Hydrogenedentes bacterium]|nr:Gfo/Idh/MocA family oxidoreductase [Candidatus Hydrogenedentota bacterium]